MKTGVIIPTRGDREYFLSNLKNMLSEQTLQPTEIVIVDEKIIPKTDKKDITKRYRTGYEMLSGKNLDAILFMEDDDLYAVDYIEKMCQAWTDAGRPTIFGTNYTIYYNIRREVNAYFYMYHDTRSSMMSTLITPDLDITWCDDHECYTDVFLWTKFRSENSVFSPMEKFGKNICIGIKHGFTETGGLMHNDNYHRYTNKGFEVITNITREYKNNKILEFYKPIIGIELY